MNKKVRKLFFFLLNNCTLPIFVLGFDSHNACKKRKPHCPRILFPLYIRFGIRKDKVSRNTHRYVCNLFSYQNSVSCDVSMSIRFCAISAYLGDNSLNIQWRLPPQCIVASAVVPEPPKQSYTMPPSGHPARIQG